ncbi:MAG: imidazolonepropionase [Armatimonadetes bacterium]|nr:imidazolonepropionase [Armatimonadota bacterium]
MANRSFINVKLATMTGTGLGVVTNQAMTTDDKKITWIGPESEMPPGNYIEIDGKGNWVLPGFIDCHTHLVYAGNRADEFEARLEGKSYKQIAEEGGGILSTVKATREASESKLSISASIRLILMRRDSGVSTIDIKSGYGLDFENEAKILRAAADVGEEEGVRVRRGYLAAHTCPPEFKSNPDAYIDQIINEDLPRIVEEGLVDYVDAFCENVGFTPEQTRRLFLAAKHLGMPIRLHADQLSDLGGAGLVAEMGGLSADHVEYTSPASVARMREHGTVAVLLPTAFYYLQETQKPPIAEFRRQGVPMAVATDHNPGTSPFTSLRLAMNMACVLFGLTPTEALRGVTINAAKAMGLQKEIGTLEVGKAADFTLWDVEHPRDIVLELAEMGQHRTFIGEKENSP